MEVSDAPAHDATTALTLDAWINPAAAADNGILFKGDAGSSGGQPYSLFINSNRTISLRVGNNSTFDALASVTQIPLNAYTHVAATYDGTTMSIYINGFLDAVKTTTTGTLANSGLPLLIGGPSGYQGAVDELEIFNRVLSLEEIQSIVAAGGAGKCKPGATPTPTPTPATGVTVQFGTATFNVTEGCVPATLTVTLAGPVAGPVLVDYTVAEGTAKQKTDFTYAAGTLLPTAANVRAAAALASPNAADAPAVSGTLLFAAGETEKEITVLITEDGFAEGTENLTVTLSNPRGASLGGVATATLDIDDNETVDAQTNPLDDPGVYVCQLYHDFLHRQPDPGGQAFWTAEITNCGADQSCVAERGHNVAAAFFLSIEFQRTGYFVYRAYEAGLDRRPRYEEFMRDLNAVGLGVEVGVGDWEQRLSDQRRAFAEQLVERADFKALFPDATESGAFADKLFQQAGVSPTEAERAGVVAAYGVGNTQGRAAALMAALDTGSVYNRLYNPGFVLVEYFGFMRRDPDDAPDANLDGYNFWLQKMDAFTFAGEDARREADAFERIKRAEMVRAFILSSEYRGRFGQP